MREDFDWEGFARKWNAPVVPRSEIGRFSGGLLTAGAMANLDCDGKGPAGAFYIGRKLVYPIDQLIAWMRERSRTVKPKAVPRRKMT